MRTPRTLSIFSIFFCIFNNVKRCIFVFCEFLKDVRFLENRNIFEESPLKAFLRQSFRVFDFSNLFSDSRYFESVALNMFSSIYQPKHVQKLEILYEFGVSFTPKRGILICHVLLTVQNTYRRGLLFLDNRQFIGFLHKQN